MYISKKAQRPPVMENPGGEILQEILGIRMGDIHSHSLAEVVIPPGDASTPHFHRRAEESYLILSGQAHLTIDGKEFELFAGDAIVIQPPEVHQIRNESEVELTFLAVCVPAWTPDDSFEIDHKEVR
jgi:mannose-6-phosphate isomerase-like protein (cupin superfamily)